MFEVTKWELTDYDVDVSGQGDAEGYFTCEAEADNGQLARFDFTIWVDRDGGGHLADASFADGTEILSEQLEFGGTLFQDAVDMIIDCVREHTDDDAAS